MTEAKPTANYGSRALRWLDAAESVILYGPVGVGKTHMAQALGHAVARRGGDVRLAKTSRVLPDLAGGHGWLCQPELAPGGRLELAPFVWS